VTVKDGKAVVFKELPDTNDKKFALLENLSIGRIP